MRFLETLFRKDASSMGADAPTIVFIPVHLARSQEGPLVRSVKLGNRKRTCTREVRTVAFKAVAYLRIHLTANTARQRCTTFRNTPRACSPKPITTTRSGIGVGSHHQRRDEHRADLGAAARRVLAGTVLGVRVPSSAFGQNSMSNIAARFWKISKSQKSSVWTNCTWAASHCFWLLIR